MTILEEIQKPNLTNAEMDYAIKELGRQPNPVEWAMLEAQWSEHCSYKSSKQLLKRLPTKSRHVLVGPGYDAGVVDVGNGWVVTLHIESHNHPSAIDPYGGAATGVGGVVRDILSLGTRPIALLDPLRFGSPRSSHSRWLFENVVRGIGDYGNCIGVPTVGGEVEFDQSFERNCLVDVVCLGLGRKSELVMAEASHPGDKVYLVGGSTGRDGIRGASFASRVLTERSEAERSAVQVPDPFMKKLIIQAVLEAVNSRLVQGMKDLGGGGITCALSEMAAKAGTGLLIDLDKVPTREPNMNPAEIMISESQERMALIVNPKNEDAIARVFEKYEVPFARIGIVTNDGKLRISFHGNIVADAPVKLVAEAPLAHLPAKKPAYSESLSSVEEPPVPHDLERVILRLLSAPNIASKEWVYRQYDHEVGLRTLLRPGEADSSLLRLPNDQRLALTTGSNSKHCFLDPYWGTIGTVSEALCNLTAAGAEPIAVVDHLQFGNPTNPEVYWTFKEAVQGVADYLHSVKVPCVGGKVSFYNEDEATRKAIKPSPVISAVGVVKEGTPALQQKFARHNSDIIMVGTTHPELGGSEYYEQIHGLTGGRVPRVKLNVERRLLSAVRRVLESGLVLSAHDCSKGGIAATISEMAIQSGKGFTVQVGTLPGTAKRLDHQLFSESRSRFVIETSTKNSNRVIASLRRSKVPAVRMGRTETGGDLTFTAKGHRISLGITEAGQAWSSTIPEMMEGRRFPA